jgi:hypothetical protein
MIDSVFDQTNCRCGPHGEEMRKKRWREPDGSAARLISGRRERNSDWNPVGVRKIELRTAIGSGRTADARKFNRQRHGPCGFQLRGDGNNFVFPRHLCVVRTTLQLIGFALLAVLPLPVLAVCYCCTLFFNCITK